jgi:hypothetical protein
MSSPVNRENALVQRSSNAPPRRSQRQRRVSRAWDPAEAGADGEVSVRGQADPQGDLGPDAGGFMLPAEGELRLGDAGLLPGDPELGAAADTGGEDDAARSVDGRGGPRGGHGGCDQRDARAVKVGVWLHGRGAYPRVVPRASVRTGVEPRPDRG